MHETSIAQRLLTQALAIAKEHAAVTIEAVSVQMGEFAGVEPALLVSAFARLAAGTIAAGASLEITVVPLTVRCTTCERTFTPKGFRFQCDRCPGACVEIVAGEELILENVLLAQFTEASGCR